MKPLAIAVALVASVMLMAAATWAPTEGALGAVAETTTTIAAPVTTTSLVPAPSTTTIANTTTTVVSNTTTTTTTTTLAPPATTATTPTPTTTRPPRQTTTTTTTTVAAITPHHDADFASGIFAYANSARSAAGVRSLKWSSSLASYAKNWARKLGDSGDLRHSNFGSLLGTTWSTVGENVAMGHLNPTAMHKAWMASSGHKANIVSADFTHVGTAVWVDASGTTWGVQVFGG
jgi:uncharacterized protein YkwD